MNPSNTDIVDIYEWADAHPIPETMYWRNAALRQFSEGVRLSLHLGLRAFVVGTHTSKSILLPVYMFRTPAGAVYLRDNFYDISVAVDWASPVPVSLEDVYGPAKDWAWYLEEIARNRGYTYRGWTDAEMDDPRILRTLVTREASSGGGTYWSEVSSAEKDRWIQRMTSCDWYRYDWSDLLIPDGPMPGCSFYKVPTAYAQGISDVVGPKVLQPFKPGAARFIVALNDWDATRVFLHKLFGVPQTPDSQTPASQTPASQTPDSQTPTPDVETTP